MAPIPARLVKVRLRSGTLAGRLPKHIRARPARLYGSGLSKPACANISTAPPGLIGLKASGPYVEAKLRRGASTTLRLKPAR